MLDSVTSFIELTDFTQLLADSLLFDAMHSTYLTQ